MLRGAAAAQQRPLAPALAPSAARAPQRCTCQAARDGRATHVAGAVAEQPVATTSGRQEAAAAPAAEYAKPRSRQWRKTAHLKAHHFQAIEIEEKERPLAEYMALPASQYSVLDAQRIERLDDSTFCCYVGQLKFFGIRVEPVLTVSVTEGPRGPTVRLLSTVLEGSPVVQAANDRFDATMTNVVSWSMPEGEAAAGGRAKQLESDATIQVSLEVPSWMLAVPVGAIERTGSGVMQRVLNTMLPRFLVQLKADYELWASGDTSRTPVGTGQL